MSSPRIDLEPLLVLQDEYQQVASPSNRPFNLTQQLQHSVQHTDLIDMLNIYRIP